MRHPSSVPETRYSLAELQAVLTTMALLFSFVRHSSAVWQSVALCVVVLLLSVAGCLSARVRANPTPPELAVSAVCTVACIGLLAIHLGP